jgi:hypothetical protein
MDDVTQRLVTAHRQKRYRWARRVGTGLMISAITFAVVAACGSMVQGPLVQNVVAFSCAAAFVAFVFALLFLLFSFGQTSQNHDVTGIYDSAFPPGPYIDLTDSFDSGDAGTGSD